MIRDTTNIWKELGDQMYFFILKRTQDEETGKEVLQNSFLKIHKNLDSVKDDSKLRAWAFQIIRNEINNIYRSNPLVSQASTDTEIETILPIDAYCCFERFVEELPRKYHDVIDQVYLKGKSQSETAEDLGISLANVKARVRRAKQMLKYKFQDCCNYKINEKGILSGEPDCANCSSS